MEQTALTTFVPLGCPEANIKEKDRLKERKSYVQNTFGGVETGYFRRSNVFKLCNNARLKSKPRFLKCKLTCALQVPVRFRV